jgi:hypothetical protein
MSDAADRPTTGAAEAAPAPRGREAISTVLPPAPPPVSAEPYRPLSLMAIAGFALALAYSLYIGGYALFTFFSGDLLFNASWTALLPLTVVIVCAIGRRAVLNSEGTLGGLRLANWGLGLTVVFALAYWSYHAATFLALRQQAAAFAEKHFLAALAKGKVEEAFLTTWTPPRPVVRPSDLREFVESNLNARPSAKKAGRFTEFDSLEYVRLLRMGGDQTRLTLKTTGTPSADKAKMRVPLLYHVDTPVKSFDLLVTLYASEVHTKDVSGRQWQVYDGGTYMVPTSAEWNPEGIRLFAKAEPEARRVARVWVKKLTEENDNEGAYLETLLPARRAALQPKVKGRSDAELQKAAETDADVREYVNGLNEFRGGSIVRAEPGTFWAATPVRDQVIASVKKRFRPDGRAEQWMTVANPIPAWLEDGKTVRFDYDVDLKFPTCTGTARITVEADADVVAKTATDLEDWRVVRMDLLRGAASAPPGVGLPNLRELGPEIEK